MPRTIRTKIYKFNELSDKAKEKVLSDFSYINVMFDWWEYVYNDAKEIGLKITSSDIDSDECDGEFSLAAQEVAQNIFNTHGESCNTYKTAEKFMEKWQPVFNNYMQTEEGEEALITLETNFLNVLLEDYKTMLKNEYEYLTSEAAIIETIESNDYEFYVTGVNFNPTKIG